ncbi:unnamed protein product [Symbiodinium sp. CCMP2456]|nr:unnamed protein product [Symbiodinium sp. CCMP2456]
MKDLLDQSVRASLDSCSANIFHRRSSRPFSTWYGPPVVKDADIKRYVDLVLADPRSQVNDPAVPDFIEREVYFVVVRFVLQMVHYAFGIVDQRALFGQTLYMLQYPEKQSSGLHRSDVELTPEMINFFMREVVFQAKGDTAIINPATDKIVYKNAVKFALRLVLDMVSSVRLSACGLRIRLDVSADPKTARKALKQGHLDLAPFEKSCEPLIEDLLSQRTLPVPGGLQKALYKNLLRTLAFCAAATVKSSELDIFGICVDPKLGR